MIIIENIKLYHGDCLEVINLKYGSILKVTGLTSNIDNEIDEVMLVNNITDGSKYNCKLLDLSTYELVADFESIEDFKNNKQIKILEVLR